jgi:hypothetical protein
VYPLAYLVYVFARGAVTGLYPYFFVDVPVIGWQAAARNAALVCAAFVLVCGVLLAANRRGREGA